ncbi:MAG: UrcA family protein [Alphaproteobacteria bacterium]|nr:UrcA family protein [Alphaproteobacteria bacterium]
MRHLLFAALLLAAPAVATPTITVAAGPSVAVAVHDLDLGTADGQRRLDDRLRRAASQVCRFTSLRDLNESRLADRCRADTLARARQQRSATLAD